MKMNPTIIEERLIHFSVDIIKFSKSVKYTFTGQHLIKQLIRSATSSALNYGEARGASSKRDFIHKCRLVLKELLETKVCLQIIMRSGLSRDKNDLILKEINELVSIFVKTLKTAEQNHKL